MPDLSIRDCLKNAEAQLKTIESAKHFALILMAHILQEDKTWVLAHDEHRLTESQKETFFSHVRDLASGKPLPYLTGAQNFYGLDFVVNDSVLIPRPETELMVDEALNWLRARHEPIHALDVGTGSGCIAISLLKNHPDLTVTALDVSTPALETARKNAENHGVSKRLTFLNSDLLSQVTDTAQLICANLPYIPTETVKNLNVTEWEPLLALDGGEDGLDLIRRLLTQSHQVLVKPGLILLEIEVTTGNLALKVAQESYPEADIRLLKDLAGKDRLIRIEVQA